MQLLGTAWSDCALLQFITNHIAKAGDTSFTKAHFKLGEEEKTQIYKYIESNLWGWHMH